MKSVACSASLWFATLLVAVTATAGPASVRSPDGRTTVTVDVDKNGAPRYAVARNGVELMPAGFLGMPALVCATGEHFDNLAQSQTALREPDHAW